MQRRAGFRRVPAERKNFHLVWISYREAVLVRVDARGRAVAKKIPSGVRSKIGETGWTVKKMSQIRRDVLARYFDKISARLALVGRFALVGPDRAKIEYRQTLLARSNVLQNMAFYDAAPALSRADLITLARDMKNAAEARERGADA